MFCTHIYVLLAKFCHTGGGLLTCLLHLADVSVRPGDHVARGARVGYVGSSGLSTGPHLHWGLFVNGTAVDPRPFLG
jgi:murein DD-endopeptidase MepM/ murein hydrolase activator NlpD